MLFANTLFVRNQGVLYKLDFWNIKRLLYIFFLNDIAYSSLSVQHYPCRKIVLNRLSRLSVVV